MSKYIRLACALVAGALFCASCSAAYVSPGRPADLAFMRQEQAAKDAALEERSSSELSFAEILARHPTAAFPTAIAVVRVQAAEDQRQRFAVVTRRDVESDESMQRLRALPLVSGIAGVSPLLLPERLDSDTDLRRIAAELHADMLLLYTLDTYEELDDESPLFSFLTLGLLPTHEVEVRTTASAVLLDTRTGYCYGLAEGTAFQNPHTSFWNWEEKTDDTRLATEREAFEKLVESVATTWTGIVTTYAATLPTQ
jgi:hypothetical protein